MNPPDRFALAEAELAAFLPEQRIANAALSERGRAMPRPGTVPPERLRKERLYRRDGSMRPTLSPIARDEIIDTAHGPVLTRLFDVPDASATIIHFHGGGWTFGSVYEQDAMLAALAAGASATCVSIDYPLAPESALPATLGAATAALAAAIERHSARPVFVLGESAGAHVAIQAVLRLRQNVDAYARISGIALTYGIYDLSMTPSQRAWGNDFLGLSTDWLEWFYTLALPGIDREARRDPSISPLYAELAGLPPALITVGALDPLLDDSLFLAARLRAAGCEAVLRVYPEAPHGFNHMATAMAAHCNAGIADFTAKVARQGLPGPAARR
jgi:acetyl esterase